MSFWDDNEWQFCFFLLPGLDDKNVELLLASFLAPSHLLQAH